MFVNRMFKKYISFLVLGVVVFLFFGESLFLSKTFVYRDIHSLMYPMKMYAASCIKDGIFPFWNPYIFCGAPFSAQVHHQTLYPLSIINYILPIFFSLDLFIFLHVFLAGIFFYLLMKDFGLDKSSSLFASLSYAFSGIFLSFGNIFITITTATWSPLILLFYFRALRRNSIFYSIITSLIIVIEFLGGLPDFLFYDIILLFFLSIAFVFHKKSLSPLKIFLIVGLVGVSISLFQTLPFSEFVLLSHRIRDLPSKEVFLWSLKPSEFISFFVPLWTAIPSEGYIFPFLGQKMTTSFYMGILPILLAILIPFYARRRIVFFFSGVLIFSIILSMGKNMPLYPFFYKHLPFFSMMRDPIKALHLASISLSILSGFGFFCINLKNLSKWLVFSAFVILLFSFIFYLNRDFRIILVEGLHPPPKTDFSEIISWENFVFSSSLIVASFLILYAFLAHLSYKNIVVAICIVDLWIFNGRLNCLIDDDFYKEKPRIVEAISDKYTRHIHSSYTVVDIIKHIGAKSTYEDFLLSKELLYGNFGMIFGLYNARGYEGVMFRDYLKFTKLPTENTKTIPGIKYIISKEGEDIKIYEQKDFLKRAIFIPNYKVLQRDRALGYIVSSDFSPEDEVILEEEPEGRVRSQGSGVRSQESKVDIIDYQPNKVVIEVEAEEPGFLFLSDTYYPGWSAYINGKKTKIYRANYCFRAVQINEGRQIIEFKYFPKTFIIGLIGSVISCIIVFVCWKIK
ncbi:TPA: hypothetical protein DCX16_02160 [bacterium]|nr:hypothetical protein [bacterium]